MYSLTSTKSDDKKLSDSLFAAVFDAEHESCVTVHVWEGTDEK